VEECAQIAMMEAGPVDPGEARQQELPDGRILPSETVGKLLFNFYTEALTVQTLEAEAKVDWVGIQSVNERWSEMERNLRFILLVYLTSYS